VHVNISDNRDNGSDVKENEERLRPGDNIRLNLISKLGMFQSNEVQKFCVKCSTYFFSVIIAACKNFRN
jgi:hypothetical protein